jgi:hypothetical protein
MAAQGLTTIRSSYEPKDTMERQGQDAAGAVDSNHRD